MTENQNTETGYFKRGKEMRKTRSLGLALLLASPLFSAYAANLDDLLKRFNNVKIPSSESVIQATDNGEVSTFETYRFSCKKQEDFSPEESGSAKKLLQRFLSFAAKHPRPTENQAIEIESLLADAVRAGSWRAKYIDLNWQIAKNRGNREKLQLLGNRLADMAREGIPIAIYGYVNSMGGLYNEPGERYRLLMGAIDRGNPQAMGVIGWGLGMRSLELRPMGKKMLECAVSQGEPGAYKSLGEIAWREGRWVDAYRLWEKGVNVGCDECIDRMEEFSKLSSSYRVTDGTHGSIPQLNALRKFYSDQFLVKITHMHDLFDKAPKRMEFHVSDEQIVQLIKLHLEVYRRDFPQ